MATDNRPAALVVDDDALIRMDAMRILEDAGYASLEAPNGDAAVAILEVEADEIELLFTDVDMPGTRDGFALAREVSRRWSHIHILVASGQHPPEEGDLPEGAVFIGKPFSAQVVHSRLRETLPDERKPPPLED